MLKFLELCVDLKKGRLAKEGLHMYKNVAQNTSVVSVETVITFFLTRSKEKLAEALAKVDEIEGPALVEKESKEMAEVEDLEASETPESILLSAVSDEKSRDRTYRTIVTPWLRFLWEAYRTSLDILRNNARLENLYQSIANEGFDFCLTHTRKTEFRRLCETLRSHLASSQKYSHQSHSINLSEPETLQRHLDTRFHQLNTAVDLELWQEAFRTAEDIHGLVSMSKRAPKPAMMATYFEKLVKVFAVGNNFLFHAAAYGKYYTQLVVKDESEAAKAAALVLLSALAVPVSGDTQLRRRDGMIPEEADLQKNKTARLAALLGLNTTPTRADLLRDALSRDVLKRVSPELRALYNILEVDFHPLSITKKIDGILTSLQQDPVHARYVEPLKEVVLARLFSQLGQVYDALSLERAIELASFASEKEDPLKARSRIERFIAGACRRGDLQVNFDHAGASVSFEQDPFNASGSGQASAESHSLQPSPSVLLQTQLTRLGQCLYAAVELINPEHSAQSLALKQHAVALQAMATSLAAEREVLLSRQGIIEKRKKQAEEQAAKRDKEEAIARQALLQAKAEETARKEREEIVKRERERVRKQAEQIKLEEAKALAQQLAQQRGIKVPLGDLKGIDTNTIVKMSVDAIEKEKRELAEKIRIVGKRMDHLERAYRKEERPLLGEDYRNQIENDRKAFESAQVNRVQEAKQRHLQDIEARDRLSVHMADYRAFRELKEADAIKSNALLEEQSRHKISEAKAKRRQEIRDRREKEMQAAADAERARKLQEEREAADRQERERAEAELRAREEAERAAETKRKRKEDEAVAAAKAQREADRAAEAQAFEAVARKQRERDAEIERKQAEKKRGLGSNTPGTSTWTRKPMEQTSPRVGSPANAEGANESSWLRRRREAAALAAASGGSATPTQNGSNENSRPATPASQTANGLKEEEGFQTVQKKTGTYRPPGARGLDNTSRGTDNRGGRW